MPPKKNIQPSLHEFFVSYNKNGEIVDTKRFFYLKWTNKFKPEINAQWLDERPNDANFIEEIKWNQVRKGHTFYLCGTFPDINEKKFFLHHETKYKNIHNLKSHLQKNIRKQDDILAISTSYHLLKIDPIEFLRRLPIIMIEDVYLHESYTTLIWLMVALSSTTSFKIKKYMYEWILGLVYVLCKINIKDQITNEELEEYNSSSFKDMKLVDRLHLFRTLNIDQMSILYSFYLRIAYGGMNCDIQMFEEYSYIWYKRFLNNNIEKNINTMKLRPISIFVKELNLEDWDLSAIDFHCNSKIIEFIKKKFPEYEDDDIKKLIWYNSSSINRRITNNEYNTSDWNKIKNHVLKTQKYLLDLSY